MTGLKLQGINRTVQSAGIGRVLIKHTNQRLRRNVTRNEYSLRPERVVFNGSDYYT